MYARDTNNERPAVKILLAVLVLLLLSPALYMLVTGDFPGSDVFYGLSEDAALVDFLLTITGR